jgi:hypothetical protein
MRGPENLPELVEQGCPPDVSPAPKGWGSIYDQDASAVGAVRNLGPLAPFHPGLSRPDVGGLPDSLPKKHFAARQIHQKLHLYGVLLSPPSPIESAFMDKSRSHSAQPMPGPASFIGKVMQSENNSKILSTLMKQRTFPWPSPAKQQDQGWTVGCGETLLTLLTLLTHPFWRVRLSRGTRVEEAGRRPLSFCAHPGPNPRI